MNHDPFLAGLRHDPDYLLQNLDFVNRRGLVVKITEPDYRNASFLDERIFTAHTQGAWFPLDDLQTATANTAISKPAGYILHVGHCGSTLISRLLAELPGNLPVREPVALLALGVVRRDLGQPGAPVGEADWLRYFDLATRTLARTYHASNRALIKVTSTAGNLIEPLLVPTKEVPRLLCMYISLESLLALMLRTPDMRDSLRHDSPAWAIDFCRLTGRDDIHLVNLSDAQQVAMKWLILMLLFTRAQSQYPQAVSLLDFEEFLRNSVVHLSATAMHFGLSSAPGQIERLLAGPLIQNYSKIPGQPFNPEQRTQELHEAHTRVCDEIRAGLQWAEKLCQEIPVLADTAGRFLD